MRLKWWLSGMLAALAGCSGVDPQLAQTSRPPGNDRTLAQGPPPSNPTWHQHRGPLAYRSGTGFPSSIGAPNPAALGQPLSGFGAVASGGPLPGQPVPESRGPTNSALASGGIDSNFSGIQRVGYEERPLRGVPPENQPRMADLNRVPAVTPPPAHAPALDAMAKPLLVAGPETPVTQQSLRPVAPPEPVPPVAAPPVPPPIHDVPPPVAQTTPPQDTVTPPPQASQPGGVPPVRMVNSKRIVLNYELKDVGPSGVSAIELWFTRDGRTWHKDETVTKQAPPYIFEVPEEGMYGFTLVARNGVGLGKQPPQPGDLPQVWVEVDLTRPVVNLGEVKNGHGPKAREVTAYWNAQDRNLARRPITLYWSDKAEGPWLPVAANIENTGQHTWSVPATGPVSFYTRIEAVDLVGNVGVAQTSRPMSIDNSQPLVNILAVEPGEQ